MTRAMIRVGLAVLVVCSTAVLSLAQQESTTVRDRKSFEIISVEGHQLVVKLPEGTKELTVPDDFRFNVNGQMLSVRELKAGMKGTAIITTRTTSTPVTVTEVKNGTVMKATGSNIMVRTNEGIRNFSQGEVDKRGVKIMRDGRPAQLSDFHEGDRISATIITSKPPQVVSAKEVQAYVPTPGTVAPPATTAAPPLAAAAPSAARPAASPAPAAQASGEIRTLPKTANSWPILALTSALWLAMGFVLTLRRGLLR